MSSRFVINFDVIYCHLDMSKLSNACSGSLWRLQYTSLRNVFIIWLMIFVYICTISLNFYVWSVFVDANTTHCFHVNHKPHILMNKMRCNMQRSCAILHVGLYQYRLIFAVINKKKTVHPIFSDAWFSIMFIYERNAFIGTQNIHNMHPYYMLTA